MSYPKIKSYTNFCIGFLKISLILILSTSCSGLSINNDEIFNTAIYGAKKQLESIAKRQIKDEFVESHTPYNEYLDRLGDLEVYFDSPKRNWVIRTDYWELNNRLRISLTRTLDSLVEQPKDDYKGETNKIRVSTTIFPINRARFKITFLDTDLIIKMGSREFGVFVQKSWSF